MLTETKAVLFGKFMKSFAVVYRRTGTVGKVDKG